MSYTLKKLKSNFDMLTSISISEIESEYLVIVRCEIGPYRVYEGEYNIMFSFKGRMIWYFFRRFFKMPEREFHFTPRKGDNMTNFIYTALFLR